MRLITGRFISIIIIISFLIIIISCSISKDTSTDAMKHEQKPHEYESLAVEKFKDNYSIEMNSNKKYVLCIKRENLIAGKSYGSIRYFVYDINNGAIIYEESFANGNVKWLNDYQIKINIVPGIVKGDEKKTDNDLGYIYDIGLKKKIYAIDYQNKLN